MGLESVRFSNPTLVIMLLFRSLFFAGVLGFYHYPTVYMAALVSFLWVCLLADTLLLNKFCKSVRQRTAKELYKYEDIVSVFKESNHPWWVKGAYDTIVAIEVGILLSMGHYVLAVAWLAVAVCKAYLQSGLRERLNRTNKESK